MNELTLQEIYTKINCICPSDKGDEHSYIQIYDILLRHRRQDIKTIVEIGIYKGASIALWSEYFGSDSKVAAVDLGLEELRVKLSDNSTTFIGNAYDQRMIDDLKAAGFGSIDLFIEDGSHYEKDILWTIEHYLPLINKNGVFIVEDLPTTRCRDLIMEHLPKDYHSKCFFADNISVTKRSDDVMFVLVNS